VYIRGPLSIQVHLGAKTSRPSNHGPIRQQPLNFWETLRSLDTPDPQKQPYSPAEHGSQANLLPPRQPFDVTNPSSNATGDKRGHNGDGNCRRHAQGGQGAARHRRVSRPDGQDGQGATRRPEVGAESTQGTSVRIIFPSTCPPSPF